MPERDRATVHVEPVGVDRHLTQAGEHLRRKRLVELDEVHLVEGEPGEFQRLADCGNRTDPEPLGLDAGRGVGHEARQRLQPVLFRERRRRDQDGRGAVARLRRVPGGDAAGRVKRRFQLRQRRQRGVAARPFILCEGHLADSRCARTVARLGHPVDQRHDLVAEAPGVDGRQRARVASQRERILLLAADAVVADVVFRDQPRREVDVGIALHQRRVRRHLVAAHRHQAHRLGAAGHDRLRPAAHDPLGRERDGLQARRAEAVDGDRRRLHRHAGPQAGDPRDVQPLLGLWHGAAEDDVVDLPGRDAGRAPQRFADDGGRHLVRPDGAQRAVRRLADGRANGGNDYRVVHE